MASVNSVKNCVNTGFVLLLGWPWAVGKLATTTTLLVTYFHIVFSWGVNILCSYLFLFMFISVTNSLTITKRFMWLFNMFHTVDCCSMTQCWMTIVIELAPANLRYVIVAWNVNRQSIFFWSVMFQTVNAVWMSTQLKRRLIVSEQLLLAPMWDDCLTRKDDELIKDALFQFLSDANKKL